MTTYRATVLYPACVYPRLDEHIHAAAQQCIGSFLSSGIDRENRYLTFDFEAALSVGSFIAAIESEPSCTVQVGRPLVTS